MKIRRRITGALCGFLDGYGSRYSDYNGYWIFGLLVLEADAFSFDLLEEDAVSKRFSPVLAKAQKLARTQFKKQIQLACIPFECVSAAKLTIQKMEDGKVGPVNGHFSHGHQLSLVAEVVSDFGKTYRAEKFLFVAPHDPHVEQQSTRRENLTAS